MASDMQEVWLAEYLKCWNATEAARRAGYKWPNKNGPENKQKFAEEIKDKVDGLTMSADEALILMTEIARGDLSRVEKPKDAGAILKKYKKTSYKDGSTSIEMELYPKDAALRDILKIRGKYGPLGTDDDPIQHRVKFIDYGLNMEGDDNPESD